tara:strand:- start:54 stop:665 length:612 start_codon:yes stop_codon:yes gene_type:complete
MKKMAKHTHKGTCQACGRVQAVNNKSGMIAKHGYTVDWGYFSGICQGSDEAPLEQSTEVTLRVIRQLQAASVQLSAMKRSDITTVEVKKRGETFICSNQAQLDELYSPAHRAPSYKRLVELDLREMHNRAVQMLDHVDALIGLIETRHGKELMPNLESVERIRETFSRIQDAYHRAEELKLEGWKPRVSGDYFKSVLTATRAA